MSAPNTQSPRLILHFSTRPCDLWPDRKMDKQRKRKCVHADRSPFRSDSNSSTSPCIRPRARDGISVRHSGGHWTDRALCCTSPAVKQQKMSLRNFWATPVYIPISPIHRSRPYIGAWKILRPRLLFLSTLYYLLHHSTTTSFHINYSLRPKKKMLKIL
jgi:hypothetical protein